ncbi:MAG: hypothetical protein EOO40_11585, partial [Deltaproteobacteria bacterium]
MSDAPPTHVKDRLTSTKLDLRTTQIRDTTKQWLRSLRRVWREVRRGDELIYSIVEGKLSEGGGPFVLHYLGRKRFLSDFQVYFERHGDTPAVVQSFCVSANTLRFMQARSRLERCPPDADLLIVDRFLSRDSDDERFALLAPFLNAYLPIAADFTAQLAQVRSKGHRRKLQGAIKRDFTWRKSSDLADFEMWYDTMYAPFVQLRFGGDASVVSKPEMLAMFKRRGFLLVLEEQGVPVSGSLMYT